MANVFSLEVHSSQHCQGSNSGFFYTQNSSGLASHLCTETRPWSLCSKKVLFSHGPFSSLSYLSHTLLSLATQSQIWDSDLEKTNCTARTAALKRGRDSPNVKLWFQTSDKWSQSMARSFLKGCLEKSLFHLKIEVCKTWREPWLHLVQKMKWQATCIDI